jgi:hypothetical protein
MIIQTFRIWNYGGIQRQQSFLNIIYWRKTKLLAQKLEADYKLCDSQQYRSTYITTEYWAKTVNVWLTPRSYCATVTRLTARTKNVGHNMYMDNSPPDLFDDLCTDTINKQSVILWWEWKISETGHSTSILIDTWNVWTNLMTRETFIPGADGPGNGIWTIFSPSGSYNSCLLWFRIMTLIIHTDAGEGPNPRDGKGALNQA